MPVAVLVLRPADEGHLPVYQAVITPLRVRLREGVDHAPVTRLGLLLLALLVGKYILL